MMSLQSSVLSIHDIGGEYNHHWTSDVRAMFFPDQVFSARWIVTQASNTSKGNIQLYLSLLQQKIILHAHHVGVDWFTHV